MPAGAQIHHTAAVPGSPTTVLDLRQLHKTLKQIPLTNRVGPGHELAPAPAPTPDNGPSSRSWSRSRTQTKSRSESKSKSHSLRRELANKALNGGSAVAADNFVGQQQTTPPAALAPAHADPSRAAETTRARDLLDKSKHRRPAVLRSDQELERDRYPFCLVWTPLPLISWLVPLLGHTGITNSTGVIYDFSDDFKVSVDNFAFGSPTKYYQFDPADIPHPERAIVWDVAIGEHVAAVLNKVKYARASDWSQTDVCRLITFYSSYNGFLGFLRQWWPTLVLVLALVVFAYLTFL